MPIYSHSRLSSFESCPRQYWYRYVEKPDIEVAETVEAFLGTRVHEALERLYKLAMGGRVWSCGELLAWYEAEWDRRWQDDVRVVRDEFSPENYRDVGRQCLADYYDRYAPFQESATLGLEKIVLFPLDEAGDYRLRGVIDRLALAPDGTYEIHDYKTSSHLPAQEAADRDRQLALYQIAVQDMWDDVEHVDLVWHYVRFDKEIRSRRTPDQLAALADDCIAIIQDIESRGETAEAFPTDPSRLCDWCTYRTLCPATRHAARTETLPPAEYKADDGVALVDRWAELRRRRQELKSRADALKAEENEVEAAVMALAEREGLERVSGSSHHAEIREETRVHYPGSGDERRPDFESVLRRHGLWDEVCTIHWKKLESLWLDKTALPDRARQALRAYIEEEKRKSASLKKGGSAEE